MFNRILVPLDGSELAERALEPALHIARQLKGEIFLLRVPPSADVAPMVSSPILPDHFSFGISTVIRSLPDSIIFLFLLQTP